MKTDDVKINNFIEKAAETIAPLWPLQTIIARNPLQGFESLKFEDAVTRRQALLAGEWDSVGCASAVNREMIKWCQVFLDEGQATITMPEREKGFYRSWALLAPFDRKLNAFKRSEWLFSLPENAEEAILFCLARLRIPENELEEYLNYSLAELPGWVGYIKWRSQWQNKEAGVKNPINLTDFLAVRLALTCALENNSQTNSFKNKKDATDLTPLNTDFFTQLKSKEEHYLVSILNSILPESAKLNKMPETPSRPSAQIVFCIDVRSEPLRMRIEREGNYETFGFAGFFGLPVSIHNYNTGQTKECCPVLVKPLYKVFETPTKAENDRIPHHQKGRSFLNICRTFYQDLKYNFGTPFALVETLGVWCGLWMVIRTLMPRSSVNLRKAIQEKIQPTLLTFPKFDIPLPHQVVHAESALRTMGLTKNFSPLVILCGHGSQTENNPYASALDCGACGGNHGGPNSKILATILNSSEVREALTQKDIIIPHDTLFIGAEHNTTTDEVVLADCAVLTSTQRALVEQLKADFVKAGTATSQARCNALGLKTPSSSAKSQILKRSSDWSETRPEWGLARNAAFIVGSRNLTKHVDLSGRCFLHSYEWQEDNGGTSLETILTAPMVVAQWINSQYFFSTLNNIAYGSGSKITHNITGKLGVMQGNSSDLMQGLPLQSVNINDDQQYHELMRLQVIIHAPRTRIDVIVQKNTLLQMLIFNHWITLVAIDPINNKPYRLIDRANWKEIPAKTATNFSGKTQQNKTCVIATMHGKEKAIAPAFSHLLGLKIIPAEIDTDRLGTFTGEMERKGSPLDCARTKCGLAIEKSKASIAIASEGSFGPHPYIPFLTCDHEILYFMDQERGFVLHQSLLSTKTNHGADAISDPQQLKAFCERVLFPSHGLIVRPNKLSEKKLIIKGIQDYDTLEEAFFKCCSLSEDGKAWVETDMRAHMNPTRMEVIRELADSFAKRLATPCPSCHNPGWGVIDAKKGLECEMCGSETEMVKYEVFGCPKCVHTENHSRKDGATKADPQYCNSCNP